MVAFDSYNNLVSEGWFSQTHIIAKEIGSWRREVTCLSSLSWLMEKVRWGLRSSVPYSSHPLPMPLPVVKRNVFSFLFIIYNFHPLFPWLNGTQGYPGRHSGDGAGRKGRKKCRGRFAMEPLTTSWCSAQLRS